MTVRTSAALGSSDCPAENSESLPSIWEMTEAAMRRIRSQLAEPPIMGMLISSRNTRRNIVTLPCFLLQNCSITFPPFLLIIIVLF